MGRDKRQAFAHWTAKKAIETLKWEFKINYFEKLFLAHIWIHCKHVIG